QIDFSVGAVERILGLIDLDPLSPTHGCAHLAYWRDKTSELADMRRQEVMLALALLYSRPYPGSPYQGDARLLAATQALLTFWCRNHYPDGSLDEWYKGERAFAAAAFGTFAVARTLEVLAGRLDPALEQEGRRALALTAGWLKTRDDLFKTNHEAVGVGALAFAGRILGDVSLEAEARRKMAKVLAAQRPDGWFPEVGHLDVGYAFLTVEYLAMAMDLWGDWREAPALASALDFACGLVHPDLAVGEEYGICHNPYLSLSALALCSGFHGQAAWLRQRLDQAPRPGVKVASTLGDDLRLLRNAWQPLLAHDYWQKTAGQPLAAPQPIPLADPGLPLTLRPGSGLARWSCGGGTALLVSQAGGLLRLFSLPGGPILGDLGYALRLEGGYASNLTYDPGLALSQEGDCLSVECGLAPVRKMMPSFIQRLLLRLLCTSALGSRLTRQGIDWVRRKKGTALNQSSSNLKAGDSPYSLSRRVCLEPQAVLVEDVLTFGKPVGAQDVFLLESLAGRGNSLRPLAELAPEVSGNLSRLTLRKRYRHDQGWALAELEARA
ncbi:MAG: hypothetical protein V1806_11840, partial [Pseudomonadota bacterium]